MMQVSGNIQQYMQKTPLRNNISIHDVIGGSETNPMWLSKVSSTGFKNALKNSLMAVGLYSPSQLGKYKLTAHLEELKQPLVGISMTVTAQVNYSLFEAKTGKEVYNKTINLPYTAKFVDAFNGSERLLLATEGAIRVNIKQLIDDLFARSKTNPRTDIL